MTNNIGDDCQKQSALNNNLCNGMDKSLHVHEIIDMLFLRHTLQMSFTGHIAETTMSKRRVGLATTPREVVFELR